MHGVTPIDAGLELIGLHYAQAIMRFVFIETLGGKVIFALGFILSLGKGLGQGNFRPALVFVFMFFTLWFICVQPRAKVMAPLSAMERYGYQDITTADVLKNNGYTELVVNPALHAVSRGVDSLITGAAAVIGRAGNGKDQRGYLASPLLQVKVSMLMRARVAAGITDQALRDEAVKFYQQDYWKAVRGLGAETGDLWPGDSRLLSAYKEDARARWDMLREALYAFVNKDKLFDRMFERFYDGRVDKDAVVKSLMKTEMLLRPQSYTLMAYASRRDILRVESGMPQAVHGWCRKVILFLPWGQGMALCVLWSLFPVFFIASVLFRSAGSLLIFAGLLAGIKAWTVLWVIVEKCTGVWRVMHPADSALMWQSPYINEAAALAALVLPLMVMLTGFIWIRERGKHAVS